MVHTALSIAGSDPSGGAGIQADLKTFSRLNVYGMSVITALTVQNTKGVTDVMDIPADIVGLQLDAVMSDIPPDALKTGMLANAAIVELAAAKIRQYRVQRVVIDPVLRSTSGVALLSADALVVFKRKLAPLALLITPNLEEASLLSGIPVQDRSSMEEAARRIREIGPRNVLVKGGHLEGDAVDILFDGEQFLEFTAARIGAKDVHGTGCVLSAAITAHLALGSSVAESVRLGKEFITDAIRNSQPIGRGALNLLL